MQALNPFRFSLFLSILLLFAISGRAAGAQAQSTPVPLTFTGDQAAKFQQIDMVSATNGWAVVGIPDPQIDPYAPPGQIYAGTFAHVLHTQDGGITWADVSPLAERSVRHYLPCDCSDNGLLNYVFLDDQHAWVANDQFGIPGNQIYAGISVWMTSDGGASWQLSETLDAITVLWMRFSDPEHGWLMLGSQPTATFYLEAPSRLYQTVDGGQHWQMVADDGVNPHYYPIRDPISSPETGIIDGKHTGMAFDSPESGWITWSPFDPPYGSLRHTVDGGTTWHNVDIAGDTRLTDTQNRCMLTSAQALARGSAAFLAACWNYGISAYQSWLYLTADAGETWQSSALPNLMLVLGDLATVPQLLMLDATTGWMVACEPPTDLSACDDPAARSLAQTLDGGATWTTLAPLPPELAPMIDVTGAPRFSFVDANRGWAVDHDGGPITTTDGGQTWTTLTPTIAPLSS